MLVMSICFSLILFYKTTNDGLLTKLCGFGVLTITSGSMQNEFQIGDIIIIKECEDYKVGDIITYNVNDDYLVTHRIIKREKNNFITKGDNNNTEDNIEITRENIEGKVIYKSKLLKWIYNHWIILVLVIFLILIFL